MPPVTVTQALANSGTAAGTQAAKQSAPMRTPHIGLNTKQREGAAKELNVALANLMLLQIKTQKVHWDIVGPQFLTLHQLLDEQYHQLNKEADEVAERVRTLGSYPIGTAAGFLALATVKEHPGKIDRATAAVEMLLDDHELVCALMREAADRCDEVHGDRGTADFFTRLLQEHEKAAWLLRSFIEGEGLKSDGQVRLPASASPSMA